MTTQPGVAETGSWVEVNQRALLAHLERVRLRLDRHAAVEPPRADGRAGAADPRPSAPEATAAETRPAAAEPSALDLLCRTFGLGDFESDLLLLAAGPELDAKFAESCRRLAADGSSGAPTFGLALAALAEPHWSALSPEAPLRYWRMVSVAGSGPLTAVPLTIDERILHYLVGVQHLDERLVGLVEPLPGEAPELVPSHGELARRTAAAWHADAGSAPQAVELIGPDLAAQRAILQAAAAERGLSLCRLRASDLPTGGADLEELARRWDREAVLAGRALWIDGTKLGGRGEGEAEGTRHAIVRLADALRGPVATTGRDRLPAGDRSRRVIEVELPTVPEQRRLWRESLGPLAADGDLGEALTDQLDAVTAQFRLDLDGIREASREAVGALRRQDGPPAERAARLGHALWQSSRQRCRPSLGSLAERIEPRAGWDDLVLPDRQRSLLRRLAVQVRRRYQVYERWGFSRRSARGLGISALFAGPSGTGKTMAAEILAGDLALDLFRIDLSSVVSKYIGETEKNLARVFDAAEGGGAILLFDEADALFGKRSEIKDSHDRYANIEVSYLLQRMEAYRGLALLTTNRRNALDAAFLRRLRFIVDFPFPDAAARADIWRRIFPSETPLGALDYGKLARLGMTGGQIRNIALSAAFAAADEGAPVDMAHLVEAARVELEKIEKPLAEAEVRGWVE